MRDWIRRIYLRLYKNTRVYKFCNLYKTAKIGRDCIIGSYSEIGDNVAIGDKCKLGAYVFIPKGVTIGREVFIGPRVGFTNDKYPKAIGDWKVRETVVKNGASIGAGCTILCGVTIGYSAKIGAGSVVTKDVPDKAVVYGNPAVIKKCEWGKNEDSTNNISKT